MEVGCTVYVSLNCKLKYSLYAIDHVTVKIEIAFSWLIKKKESIKFVKGLGTKKKEAIVP